MAQPRLRAALAVGVVLVISTPLLAQAIAPHLTCGVTQSGRWERIPVPNFQSIDGIAASDQDVIAAYTVDKDQAQDLAATNGSSITLTHSNGCAWATAFALSAAPTATQPFSGATASIVSLGLLRGRVLAAVQEGSGPASRPHVLVSGRGSGWAASDTGLPVQGAPRLLRVAGDGQTAYLTISPTANGGSDSSVTDAIAPTLPGGGSAAPTGFLYRTTDGGASWSLRTGAAELPGGGTGFSQLEIDPSDADRLYGIVGGRLLMSRDGGGSFSAAAGSGFSAVTALGPAAVVAFTSGGVGRYSADGGTTFSSFPAPAGITSAASRPGSSAVAIERNGALQLLEPGSGQVLDVPAASPARPGSLLGDRAIGASFHAVSGHEVLRYVDPVPPDETVPPLAVGDLTVPPPIPGLITPGVRNISLPVGTSELEDFTLDLPKNPTPLDLFFLVDVSSSMGDYIADLQKNVTAIVAKLTAARVNLKVGLGTLGTGPAPGERPYPPGYVYPPQPDPDHPGQTMPGPTYKQPRLYELLRRIGDSNQGFQDAVARLKLETTPVGTSAKGSQNHEGQLIALEQLLTGSGVQTQDEAAAKLPRKTAVVAGQQAGFRDNPDVRKVVIVATNEKFDAPFPTRTEPGSTVEDPKPDFAPTLAMLNAHRTQVIGLTAGAIEAQPDLQKLAGGTRTLAPVGGVSCGGDPPQELAAGDPLVCNNGESFSDVISRLLASLVDRQDVQLSAPSRTPVLGALDGHALLGLNVKQTNQAHFQVRVTCVDVRPGTYQQHVQTVLRRTVVGQATLNVTCVQAAVGALPRPVPALDPPAPPGQPVVNVVAPVAPPPPAAQPQAQPQVQPQVQAQVQLQPLTAGAVQEQQELQLALAMNGVVSDQEPAFSGGQQLAMVDRRRRDEVQAAGLLAFAMTVCAGLGLARLRTAPRTRVRSVTAPRGRF